MQLGPESDAKSHERLYLTTCFDPACVDETSETRCFRQAAYLIFLHHLSLQVWSPLFGFQPGILGNPDPTINSNQQLQSKIQRPIKLHSLFIWVCQMMSGSCFSYLWNVFPALNEKHCKLCQGVIFYVTEGVMCRFWVSQIWWLSFAVFYTGNI